MGQAGLGAFLALPTDYVCKSSGAGQRGGEAWHRESKMRYRVRIFFFSFCIIFSLISIGSVWCRLFYSLRAVSGEGADPPVTPALSPPPRGSRQTLAPKTSFRRNRGPDPAPSPQQWGTPISPKVPQIPSGGESRIHFPALTSCTL